MKGQCERIGSRGVMEHETYSCPALVARWAEENSRGESALSFFLVSQTICCENLLLVVSFRVWFILEK